MHFIYSYVLLKIPPPIPNAPLTVKERGKSQNRKINNKK